MPLSGGPSLTLASGPMSWQGEHNRLNTCSPGAASCANAVPVEAATTIPAIIKVFIIFLLLEFRTPPPARRRSRIDPKPALINAQVGSSRLAIAIAALFEWRQVPAVSTAQMDNLPRCRDARSFFAEQRDFRAR